MDETEMTSNDMFAILMDNSAAKMDHSRTVALELLELATDHENRAENLRHLAALMILEAQAYAAESADLLAMEFPMGSVDEEESDE
jgi:hypothetical protein